VPFPNEVLQAIEGLGAQCTGDIPALIGSVRIAAPGNDDASLARAIEEAATRRARAGDRGATWWLACAVATLRASSVGSPQEDAELVAARVLGELSRSPAALAPLPPGARWIMAGYAEPPATREAIELARKNATTYLERLDAELAGRAAALQNKAQVGGSALHAPIEAALASYVSAIASTRAAVSRACDYILARDASHADLADTVLRELDEVVTPPLRSRIEEVRRTLSGVPVQSFAEVERPSFAGAAPPSFQPGGAVPSVPPQQGPRPTVEELDAAMRAAFERAWSNPDPANRAAFEQAVRARYEVETASMPDPDARQKALDHYVAHALSQLPPTQ
jgi:hypothetical protein